MDPRIKLLSYSALQTFHKCARKFQLYRLNSTKDDEDPVAATNQNVTFAFGHVVGDGIQQIFSGASEEEVIFSQFLGWHADLADELPKDGKSFYLAMIALQKLMYMRSAGYLDDWEVVQYNGRPAVELSFRITFPDGFTMRGSVDAVLRHKVTGEIRVLECKTTKSKNLNAAMYKNSAQGVGYSCVLDVLFPDLSSYAVLYLVYKTLDKEYEQLPFVKTYLQRATWIQELLLDIEVIKLYETAGVYPMNGDSCYSFFRECEYLNVCTLSTANLTKPWKDIDKDGNKIILDAKVYDFELTMNDLIMGQLKKNQTAAEKQNGNVLTNAMKDILDNTEIL